MPIKFRCEHCRQLLGISQSKAGEMVDCPTCGRGVRVPSLDGKSDPVSIPKWDPKDRSLVNALDALASLTGASGGPEDVPENASSNSADTASSDDNASRTDPPSTQANPPVATAIPEPIDLPPLETPVVIPEPPQSLHPSAHTRPDVSDQVDEPWAKLATLPNPAQTRHGQPAGRAGGTPSASSPPGKGVTLPIALLLVGMAFLLGYFVGNARNDSSPPAAGRVAEKVNTPEPENPAAPGPQAEPARRRAVEGRVTYLSATGSSQSDTGAVVILLPAYRNSSARIPIVGCRPADSSEDREIATAMVKALGGDLAVVDERGLYSCDLPQAGEYHLIVMSRHLERAEEDSLEAPTRTMLGEYFDRPQQLVGQLQFHAAEVSYRGEKTEIYDHTFGRES